MNPPTYLISFKLIKTPAIILAIVALSLSIRGACAQSTMTDVVYSTDFNTSSTGYVWSTNGNGTGLAIDSYPSYWGTIINGQDGWVSNQGYEPNTFGPGLKEFYNAYNVNNWTPTFAAFGGDAYNSTTTGYLPSYPQNAINDWIKPFNNTTNSVYFQSKFALNATAPNINNQWDTFAFTLFNTALDPLVSINFNAAAADGSTWQMTYSTYGIDGVTNQPFIKPNSQPLNLLQNMQLAYLGFDVLNLGQTNQSLVMYNTYYTNSQGQPAIILTNSLLGTNFSGIDTKITALAATWEITDTTTTNYNDGGTNITLYPNYANNTLVVENLSISIPEPHTAGLLYIASTTLAALTIIRRRRHRQLQNGSFC